MIDPERAAEPGPDAEPGSPAEIDGVDAAAPPPPAPVAPGTPDAPKAPSRRRRRFRIPGVRGPLELAIRALLLGNALVIGLLAIVFVTSLDDGAARPDQATPEPSIDLMSMGLAHIPTSSSCLLCHESGGSGGLKPIPAIGHPLEGWRRCLTCHTNEELGRKAPGHLDIPETECLNCHQLPPEGPAITQPHSQLQDQECLDCHGTFAHLPTSMVAKDENECWLCHIPTELPPPEYPHVLDPALGCRECHQSAQTGGLPIDHALREDSTCLLCHEIRSDGPIVPISPLPGSPSPSP